MPSASLLQWRNDRMPRLDEIDAQCAISLSLVPARPALSDENLRGYVLLLSAHFQGFSRDLYTECSLIVVSRVRTSLQVLTQSQFTSNRRLDYGNPNLQNLKTDFERFNFILDLPGADPGNPLRVTHLGEMNSWRNLAAHHGTPTTAAGLLTLPRLRSWRDSCNGLATSLDGIMYNELRRLLRRPPWLTP